MEINKLTPINETKPAEINDSAARQKEEDKKAVLEKLNNLLSEMIKSFHDNQYPLIKFEISPPKEREFFTNLNNPYSYPDFDSNSNVIPNTLLGTAASYGIALIACYDMINNRLGYPATVSSGNNLASPFVIDYTVSSSLYNAYRGNSTLRKYDIGSITGAGRITNALISDGIYDNINKMPAKTRPLAAIIGLYGYFNPAIIPLADKENPRGTINNLAGGLNVSPDSVSLFTLFKLLLEYPKIKYLYDTALGKNVEKPKEGSITSGSWIQDGNAYTGIKWKF